MSIAEVGTGELIAAVAAMVGGFWAVVKLALWQFEKRLTERFNMQETARVEDNANLDRRFALQEKARVAAKEDWDRRFGDLDRGQRNLERDFLGFKAELPVNYVRREDAIREQTIINAKLDALAVRLDAYFKREAA